MQEERSFDVPTLNIGSIVEQLGAAYCAVISSGTPLTDMPSVMLWGPPGVGKSQAVRQLAALISGNTGKRTEITDVRLLLFNPIDLRGIPVANEDKTLAVWLKPKIFQMDESPDVINILFLDEISSAPASVQAAAYQITLDRTVGEHRLPDNCIVIAAGNRVTDKSVAVKMPKALANRLLHLETEADFASWKKWAIGKGVNPKVIGFLSFRRDRLMTFDPATNDRAFATPRSWEMVSNILNHVNSNIEAVFPLISGLIGSGAATELLQWEKVYAELPSIPDIFAGINCKVPTSTDTLYALCASMVVYAKAHKDDMNQIANSIRYADRMPPDFSVLLLKDYMDLEKDYRKKLMKLPEFNKWVSRKGVLLNGSV